MRISIKLNNSISCFNLIIIIMMLLIGISCSTRGLGGKSDSEKFASVVGDPAPCFTLYKNLHFIYPKTTSISYSKINNICYVTKGATDAHSYYDCQKENGDNCEIVVNFNVYSNNGNLSFICDDLFESDYASKANHKSIYLSVLEEECYQVSSLASEQDAMSQGLSECQRAGAKDCSIIALDNESYSYNANSELS